VIEYVNESVHEATEVGETSDEPSEKSKVIRILRASNFTHSRGTHHGDRDGARC
jgi:hypothetical protein